MAEAHPRFSILPLQVKAVDVIGAADAAVGGLTAGLARQLSLQHSMVWATCCGSLSLLSSGAQDSMPRVSELHDFMAKRQISCDEVIARETGMPQWCGYFDIISSFHSDSYFGPFIMEPWRWCCVMWWEVVW